MSRFEKIKNIIKSKKDEYVENNKDLTINENKDNFKKLLKPFDNFLIYIPLLFIIWFVYFLNIFHFDQTPLLMSVFLISLLSFLSSLWSALLVHIFFDITGITKFFNSAYIIYKLKSKKNKEKIIIKTLENNFINLTIDSKTIYDFSNYLTKEEMLEFLSKHKSNPSYEALYDFCNQKEGNEKKLLENKDSQILLNDLVDDMYSKDKALN